MSWQGLVCVVVIVGCVWLVMRGVAIVPYVVVIFATVGWLVAPPVIIVTFARHKLHAALVLCLTTIFWYIIALSPLRAINVDTFFSGFGLNEIILSQMIWVFPLIL